MSTILDQLVLRVCNSSGSVKTCHGPVGFFFSCDLVQQVQRYVAGALNTREDSPGLDTNTWPALGSPVVSRLQCAGI